LVFYISVYDLAGYVSLHEGCVCVQNWFCRFLHSESNKCVCVCEGVKCSDLEYSLHERVWSVLGLESLAWLSIIISAVWGFSSSLVCWKWL